MKLGDAEQIESIDEGRVWPDAGLETVDECPVCGSAKRTLLYDDLKDRIFGCAQGTWTLYQCDRCDLGYLDPRPTRETIGLAYSDYYTHYAPTEATGQRSAPVPQERFGRRVVRACLNGYRNRRFGSSYDKASFLGGFIVQFVRPLAHYFDASARYLEAPSKSSNLLLDVGSGSGKFLLFARDCGWNVSGFDFDESAVAVSRQHGLNVKHGTFDDMHSRSDEFDMITASHVIEHVYSPAEMIVDMHRLLKPNGRVWLETPNIKALGLKRFGKNWRGLEPPRHLMLFSMRGMKDLLEQHGFTDIKFHNRGLNTPFVYAESELIAKGMRINASAIGVSFKWTSIIDGVVEYFSPDKREFLTVTARKAADE